MRRHHPTRRALLCGGLGHAAHVAVGAAAGCGGTTGGKLVALRTSSAAMIVTSPASPTLTGHR